MLIYKYQCCTQLKVLEVCETEQNLCVLGNAFRPVDSPMGIHETDGCSNRKVETVCSDKHFQLLGRSASEASEKSLSSQTPLQSAASSPITRLEGEFGEIGPISLPSVFTPGDGVQH